VKPKKKAVTTSMKLIGAQTLKLAQMLMLMWEAKPDLTLAIAKAKKSQSQFSNVSETDVRPIALRFRESTWRTLVAHERYANMQRQGLVPRAIKMRAGQMNFTIAPN
jgi:hypothetical protein